MNQYQFKYKGKTYECVGVDKDFQIKQFKFLLETGDYVVLQNRILNQMKAWECLIEVDSKTNGTFTPTVTPSRTESIDSDITINQNGKQKIKFW